VEFIHNGFSSALKKNEISLFSSKCMELENIIMSEANQTQKTKNHMFSLIMWTLDQGKCSNVVGLGSHCKERAHREELG
jgi:hypothetical protein